MPTTINGTTGVSQVQDGTIASAKIVDGSVAQADLDATNKLAQCKAWANFDGTLTGTITPRSSFGISSIVRNAAGDYTITLSATMADANYCTVIGAGHTTASQVTVRQFVSRTSTSFRFVLANLAGVNTDVDNVHITVMGN